MPIEDGVNWRPTEPDKRGRHGSFASAVVAALKELSTERSEFFDSLADRWQGLFPNLAARPGRYEDGKVFLYVKSAPTLYSIRPRLAAVKSALAALPGAPKRLDIVLEIRR